MYLPVILIERFGWPGFVAFAVPNVLGCSAMGFVLARHRHVHARQRSETLVAAHGPMMLAFSTVTVAFQVFFAVWLLGDIVSVLQLPWWAPLALAGIVFALGLVFAFLNDRDWLALSALVYAISVSAAVALGFSAFDRVPAGTVPLDRLLWLIPTICFGFVLCPYLDLTFHRAFHKSLNPRLTFAMFGVTFALMLVLTVMLWFGTRLWYAHAISILAVGHIIAQLTFTCGAHLREVRVSVIFQSSVNRWLALLAPIIGVAALPIARWAVAHIPGEWLRKLSPEALAPDASIVGEWIYLDFMFAYGMIFPAYVLLAMASGRPFARWREWLAFGVLVLAAVPCYAAGFLFNRTAWLLPPLALVVGWLIIRRRT
jgi:hypothetical protein